MRWRVWRARRRSLEGEEEEVDCAGVGLCEGEKDVEGEAQVSPPKSAEKPVAREALCVARVKSGANEGVEESVAPSVSARFRLAMAEPRRLIREDESSNAINIDPVR